MNYAKYNKIFLKMEPQSSHFAGQGEIKGYVKIETGNHKGILSCALENLRYFKNDEYLYHVVLFGRKGGKTIYHVLGETNVKPRGVKEASFRFKPGDVDGNDNTLHDFDTVVIAAVSSSDPEESIHPVLKAAIFESQRNDSFERSPAERNAPRQEESQAASARPAPKRGQRPEPRKEEIIDRRVNTYNHYYNEYILKACTHIHRVSNMYEEADPFEDPGLRFRWKKIMNVRNLPFVAPGAHSFAAKYHHYLFAAAENREGKITRYYFGIPGKHTREEQPDSGKSGFVFWQPLRLDDDSVQIATHQGYWLIAVNGITGDIEEV